MKSVHAYFGDGVSKLVYLGKDITSMPAESLITDVAKLQAKFEKEKARDPNAIAIARFQGGDLTFYDNGKFRGIHYPTRASLAGTWILV